MTRGEWAVAWGFAGMSAVMVVICLVDAVVQTIRLRNDRARVARLTVPQPLPTMSAIPTAFRRRKR